MFKNIITLSILLITLSIFTGCASIISGGNQSIYFDSIPQDAEVTIRAIQSENSWEGTTPFTAELKRKHEYRVTVKLDGYETTHVRINRDVNNWVVGNLILGIMPWVVIDYATGAMFELKPDEILITLEEPNSSKKDEKMELVLYSLNEDGKLVRHYTEMNKENKITI